MFWGLPARSTSATWLLLIENTKAAPAGKPYNFSGLLEGANNTGRSVNLPQAGPIIAVPAARRELGVRSLNFCKMVRLQDESGRRVCWAECRGAFPWVSTTRRTNARGRFLLRDLALSFPIFGDPVRVPDHNACYPRIARHPRATARAFTSRFGYHTRCKSFPSAVLFQLPGSSLVAESRRRLLVRSLLLEDHSSSETNSTLDT
jgi:hypothetical protein